MVFMKFPYEEVGLTRLLTLVTLVKALATLEFFVSTWSPSLGLVKILKFKTEAS